MVEPAILREDRKERVESPKNTRFFIVKCTYQNEGFQKYYGFSKNMGQYLSIFLLPMSSSCMMLMLLHDMMLS